MSIKKLQQRLDELGYHTYISISYLNVARKVSDDDPRIIELNDYFCAIPLEGDQLKVSTLQSQIPDWVLFDSEVQVIAYIKKQFPL
jgi:hypothetical protein